ncbi:Salicylate hydroxylase [Ilyonectria robusta]
MASTNPIAIIGAGLSGLSLALALHNQNISSVLYETQSAPLDIGGAIMLSPNALRILDRLGVLQLLEPRGYKFEQLFFRSGDDKLVDEFEFGSAEKYGYSALRVYRYELINVLLDLVKQADIRIEYGKKFDHVISETDESVTWQFADGSEGNAPLLVGADGIHSRVRQHLYPGLVAKFTNMLGITAAIPTAQLQADDDYPIPVTIMNPKHGAFVIAPQLADGSEVLIGKQYRFAGPEPDREGWKKITSDKQWAVDFLRQSHEDFPAIVHHATSSVSEAKVNVWPFYLLPKLDTWASEKHARVVILGDAAHAIPPTAGQGVNQAFEDIYIFAGVIAKLRNESQSGAPEKLKTALRNWQNGRQARIDQVLQVNDQINERRMPSNENVEFKPFDLEWLYSADFDKMVAEYAGSLE